VGKACCDDISLFPAQNSESAIIKTTEQYAFVNQQFALREENTELPNIKLYSVESHFHLVSCSIEHSARVWPSETQGAPKEVTLYSALSSDEMSDNAFFKYIARLIPQILQLQPPAWAGVTSRESRQSRVGIHECVSAVRVVEVPVFFRLPGNCNHAT
jgi:hypothetical protein